jgi:voltage-dependent calcium channel L type alpha-1D
LRKLCLRIATSRFFDGLIIVAIIVNSVIIGLSDFDVVDKNLNPASQGIQFLNGELVPAFSMRNYIVEISEMPSTVLFACESIIKIIAFGFISGPGTYLRDSWNQLDFFVVLSSLVGVLPGIPNVSAIRTIRVLRPLRSLSMIPGMRRLISALLKALPALANVLILQLFVFAIFGILGFQLFGGNMNRRCRLTEHAVKLPLAANSTTPLWPVPKDYLEQVLADPEAFRCLEGTPMLDDGDPQSSLFTKESSPWRTPQDCFWPIDDTDKLLCVVPGVAGNHPCAKGQTCGSDYDTYGNQRFTLLKVMDAALFSSDLNWGFTNFDNIGRAFFTIFQSITMEGWTVIMYMVMDGGSPLIGALFFVILIIFASFFVMNLTLAVISDEFNIDDDDDVPTPSTVDQKALALLTHAKQTLQTQRDKPRFPRLFQIVSHPVFSTFIMLVILANTAVLALDHHPMPPKLDSDLEMINFGLSCVFLLEMFMKLVGLGFRLYARDKFNLFDAFVVTMGVLETIASPPSFLTDDTEPRKGAVSALRSFRLFRVFKLARDWSSFRGLLELIIRAVASIANFAVLLFLFIYIYALVGLQFFANTMRYDGDGYLIPGNGVSFWEGNVCAWPMSVGVWWFA